MPRTLASRRWRNWLQQLASWPLGGRAGEGRSGAHKWKQNILELKSQWLEDQEAGGLAPRDPGTARPLSSVELFTPGAPAYPGGF